jgi:hypothetical protein
LDLTIPRINLGAAHMKLEEHVESEVGQTGGEKGEREKHQQEKEEVKAKKEEKKRTLIAISDEVESAPPTVMDDEVKEYFRPHVLNHLNQEKVDELQDFINYAISRNETVTKRELGEVEARDVQGAVFEVGEKRVEVRQNSLY